MVKWRLNQRGIHWRVDTSLYRNRQIVSVAIQAKTREEAQARLAAIVEGSDDAILRDTQEQLRVQATALEAAANAMMITDREGRIRWVNPAFERLSGFGAAEVVGQTPRLLKSGQHDAAFYGRMWRTILWGQVWRGEVVNKRKDGSCYSERMTITPVQDAQGAVTHFIAIKEDVTEIVRAREVLARDRRELERLVAERTASLQETTDQLNEFVYTVAHDLRAPLRAQHGFSRVLLEDFGEALGETGRHHVLKIQGAAARLDALVSDLLSYATLSREKPAFDPVDLKHIVALAEREHAEIIRTQRASVSVGEIREWVWGHEIWLQLAVNNLLSNALKFVKPGRAPEVRVWTERGCPGWVRLWVEDAGIGIASPYHEKIFGVFQQLCPTPEYSGTGIGLAIVRRAVERLGGRAGVESEPGLGSRFWIELRAV